MATPIQVVFDCANPARIAEFWATALGYTVQPPPEGFPSWEKFLASMGVPESEWNSRSAVVDPDGAGPRIFFQRVPEPKTVKNRVHLDVNAGADATGDERRRRVDAEVERLTAAGATTVAATEDWVTEEPALAEYWVVMQDPEGNEFCVQ
jgi:glyoxalase superfamily protein